MAGFLGLFGCSKKDKPYEVEDVYNGLRSQIFELDPNAINIQQDQTHPKVWGILMETGYPEAVATLVALGDGTVSMYFSNGGGMIGLGQHEQPRLVANQFLEESQSYTEAFSATEQYPLPKKGHTVFYLLTFDGVLTAEAKEDVLGNGQHELSPLFLKGHELITQARIADEAARAEQAD